MNSHLRRHTKSYKCGWCGKTFPDGAKFHQHSAMSHGDKIPDLVKDPEAEAEYEALKGLMEHQILLDLKERPESAPDVQLVAKKSTCPASRSVPGDRCRNVSRKSTGAGAKFWPETKIEQPYSFYGIQPERFDPKLIKTRMAMGGIEITLDAEKMMGLMNLKPQLSLEDCGAMVAHAAPPGQEQGHKNAEDHEHRQEQSHGPGREEDGQEGAYGYEQEQGHFHKQSHGIVNQNMMADEDSEEELIDDLLKDV